MEEKLLAALRARAYRGACRIEDKQALAAELGISVGKLRAPLRPVRGGSYPAGSRYYPAAVRMNDGNLLIFL